MRVGRIILEWQLPVNSIRNHITGKFFYFGLNIDTNKSVEQMHANISAAEDRAHVSKGEVEQAKKNKEEARWNAEEAKRKEEEARGSEEKVKQNEEEARMNEERAMKNAAEAKRRRLALEAEL
jgi:hypothetical protein